MMNTPALESLSPDVAIHRAPQSLYGVPIQRMDHTPEQILRRNFGRQPLRCDEGDLRNDFAAAQAGGAARGPRI